MTKNLPHLLRYLQKKQKQKFFSLQERRLVASFEGLNSSLVQPAV